MQLNTCINTKTKITFKGILPMLTIPPTYSGHSIIFQWSFSKPCH